MKKSIQINKSLTLTLIYFILIVLAIVFIIPIIWMFSTSLKSMQQLFMWPPKWFPHPLVWNNYIKAIQTMPFFRYFMNTIIIACFTTIGHTLSSSFVAYGFARLRFPGRNILFILVISTMMMPEMIPLIPQYIVFRHLGWINTFLPIIIPSFAGFPFYIFLARQFFLTIPDDLSDAARIDGCSEFGIWWKIMLPLSKPALIVITILSTRKAWNEFLRPLVYLQSINKRVLSVGLYEYMSMQSVAQNNLLMAASAIMVIPIIIMFIFLQKYFVQGVTLTGLKS